MSFVCVYILKKQNKKNQKKKIQDFQNLSQKEREIFKKEKKKGSLD